MDVELNAAVEVYFPESEAQNYDYSRENFTS